jgi:hypothetical protein
MFPEENRNRTALTADVVFPYPATNIFIDISTVSAA